jgi:uncharacterized membrane protein YeaQ/YmgE (transglycosylase-associated protein family)
MNEEQKQARSQRWGEYRGSTYRRWRVYSTFLTGFLIGLFYVLLISGQFLIGLDEEGQKILVLIFSGILGGVIYSIVVDGNVEMPRFVAGKGDLFEAGLFGDILLGIAGAVVLDYVRQQFGVELNSNIDLAAAGIVGGYGGRAILKFALTRVFKDINLLEADRQKYLQTSFQQRLERKDSLTLIDQLNQQVRVGLVSAELAELTADIKQASADISKRVFNLAQEFRRSAHGSGEKARVERTIPIFEALIESDSQQHQYYAELAFAYKDSGSPDLFKVIQYLDRAISLRGDQQRTETWNYELSRAITRIQETYIVENGYEFDTLVETKIIQDLLAVASIYNLENLLKDVKDKNIPRPILSWVKANQAELISREDTRDLALKVTNLLDLDVDGRGQEGQKEVVKQSPSVSIASPAQMPKREDPTTITSIENEAKKVNRKIDRDIFFKEYRSVFKDQKISQEKVDTFDAIFDYWDNSEYTDLRWLSYALATAYHETGGRMLPVREGFAKSDAAAIETVKQLLATGRIKWNYAKLEANGKSYFGRGLVQITHAENYLKLGKAIGLETKLYDDPSLALDKDISVKLLFKGMIDGLYSAGNKLSVYFNQTQNKEDWYGARAIINADKSYKPGWANGKSIGQMVEEHGRAFYRCCKASVTASANIPTISSPTTNSPVINAKVLSSIPNITVPLSFEVLATQSEIAKLVQSRLINLGLLDPPVDGKFGSFSKQALQELQTLMHLTEVGFGEQTRKLLSEIQEAIPLKLNNDLASRIIQYMKDKKYFVSLGKQKYNIVYVEGADLDGTPNADTFNQWNDRRIVIEIADGTPRIIGNWLATTEPGKKPTNNPSNPMGVARIAFDQYQSWRVGIHNGNHEALVQDANVKVHRDGNRDTKRIGDFVDEGLFGINQHWGFDMQFVENASAGCLVGQSTNDHKAFMQLIKQDRRYKLNSNYMFFTTIIPGDELAKRFPA